MRIFTELEPLPTGWHGTPQEMLQAFIDRLTITTDSREFVPDGAIMPHLRDEPITDGRPWFKNGVELWVWDSTAHTYVVVSAKLAVLPQVSISSAEPDPALYGLWLETDNNTVSAFKVYLGSTAGWVGQSFSIPDGSITTAKFQDFAVTSTKLASLSITTDKFAPGLLADRWGSGGAGYYLRMNAAGDAPEWQKCKETVQLPITLSSEVSFAHGATEAPFLVEAALVCIDPEHGWVKDDEIKLNYPFLVYSGPGTVTNFDGSPGVYVMQPLSFLKNSTKVSVHFPATVYIHTKSEAWNTTPSHVIDPAKWVLQFRITYK